MLRTRLLTPMLFLSLLAAPAHATLLAEAAVRTSVFGDITNVLCLDGGSGSTAADAQCSQDGNFGWGRATAAYGELETYARLYSTAPPSDNDNYQAYGWSRFSDRLQLQSPLIDPGDSTNARVIFDFTGSVLRDIPDFPNPGTLTIPWTFTVRVNGLELQPSNGPVLPVGEFWYDFNITPGTEVLFSAELISDVRCFGCDGAYEGIVDFFGTVSVTEVQVGGLDPADFVISSLEGASYANVVPVPEPASGLLLTIGLLGLAARAGHRRS